MELTIEVPTHPLLDLRAFVTHFDKPLGQLTSPPELLAMLKLDAETPFQATDDDRKAVRDLLRHGGFKPTGRSKPASEYLIKAARENKLASINPAVDVCNIVSLHSGLPISVVDLEVASEPFRVDIADQGSSYVFNVSGQMIDISGLLCLFDRAGPCGNAVKDSQRTKTSDATTRTLSVIWGTNAIAERSERALQWYCQLLESTGHADVEQLG